MECNDYEVLASGIDSLNLTANVHWKSTELFGYLKDLKQMAVEKKEDCPGELADKNKNVWKFNMQPYGLKGYEWMLVSQGMVLKIGNWMKPKSMPSVLIEIRSETLWRVGATQVIDWLISMLHTQGGLHLEVKPSRVDLCVDFLLPEMFWNQDIAQDRVTRARALSVYLEDKKMQGIGIGRGQMSARIYDKALEIKQKSKKFWMYQIWGISKVPQGKKVIRVEFQFRREMLKEIGINDVGNLMRHYDRMWGYASQKWLKFQSGKGKHHTQRKTLAWWKAIQDGFLGMQEPCPLLRCVAFKRQKEQLEKQAKGQLISLLAIKKEIYPYKKV